MQEILEYQDKPDFMTQTNIWILNLARNEPNLFELLYLSDSFDSQNIWDVKMKWESNQKMMSVIEQSYKLTKAECKDIFLREFFMLFGIATMITKSKIDRSNDEAINIVKKTVSKWYTL